MLLFDYSAKITNFTHSAHFNAKIALSECTNQYSFALLECISDLVAPEDVAGVDFVVDVVEAAVVAVGYDGVASGLEFVKVVYYCGSEERRTVFECRFIDDDFSTFGLDAFHHALD